MFNLKSFARQSLRVCRLLKKPDSQEFKTISKVSAIGLGLVGLLGFLIALVMGLLGLS